MSEAEHGDKVVDEEGDVDTKIKTRILKNRKRIDDAEEALFVEAVTDPNIRLSPEDRILTWGTVVKQFLRTIEPLLRDESVKNAKRFYKQKEIGKEVLVPPDTEGYEFSRIAYTDQSDRELRQMLGLPRNAEVPKPEIINFVGLEAIIEAPDILQYQWDVTVENSGPPTKHKNVYPHAKTVISKEIFVDAVRYADQFLQNAGIGLEIGGNKTDIIRGFDQSGEDTQGDLDEVEYSGDPDI